MVKFSVWVLAGWISTSAAIAQSTAAEVSSRNPLSPAPSVQSLLTKMSQASSQAHYRGVFTYQNQNSIQLQSFQVEHWVDHGVEHDRFLFLNGPERLILRDGHASGCQGVGDVLLQGGFAQFGKTLAGLDSFYQFEVRGQERVAGRIARVLQVIPKDAFRYGYLLSIDEETGVVLKSWLIDAEARPLERYQYASIVFTPSDAHMEITAKHQKKIAPDETPCDPQSITQPTNWQITWVPSGFVFAGERKLAQEQTMLMYTDGLTTFSIFIEPTISFVPEGVGQSGATLAYMSRLTHKNVAYRMSVVGEVPVAAATKIAQSIRGQ